MLAWVWRLLFRPHSPFPPSASLNPSWSISCYVAPTCLCANGDYASLRCSRRLTSLVMPCSHKLVTLSKSLLWHSKHFEFGFYPKLVAFFFFFQARWLAQATHKSISFNQIITMTNILQLFSLIYSVLIHLIQFGPRAGKMIRIPCVCNNLYPGCLDSNGSQNYGYCYH